MAKAASIVLAALVVVLAGCGGGGSKSASTSAAGTQPAAPAASAPSSAPAQASAGANHSLNVAADPSGQLSFTKTSLSAKAGKVTIAFANNSSVDHNLTIQQGTGGPNLGATPTFTGGSKVLSVNLKPGTYTFYCSVPGHRQAGMHGTLVVK